MRKFRKYTATALVAMMVAGMTMSGYQPADVSASQESEYIIVTKDKKSMKTVHADCPLYRFPDVLQPPS